MVDLELSAAVVDYVWGVPRKPWPTCRASSLSPTQLILLPEVEAAMATARSVPATWSDLAEGHALAAAAVRRAHPTLSDEAVQAVANAYAYAWR